MAPKFANHAVRSFAVNVSHALFPSRRAALVALGVDVAALVLHVPLAAHALLALVTHVALGLRRE